MRIAQVAPPFETVPPTRYGGTERVVSTLTEELVRRGHDVTLFASGDSSTSARLIPTVDRAVWHQDTRHDDFAPFWTATLRTLLEQVEDFDVIHSHLDYFGFPMARDLLSRSYGSPTVVTTLHGLLAVPELRRFYEAFPDVPLVSISEAQRWPAPHANWVGNVYHGLDLDQFSSSSEPGSYLAFLGRISPEKGLDTAIQVALRAGMPLKIGAREPLPFKNDPNTQRDWEYYEQVIRPLLTAPGIEMVGEVGGEEKNTLLRDAAALLFPIQWPEPFGLVMIEALACGTPVLALRNGSVPEVIQNGVTGWIADTEDELVAAVGRIGELERTACRIEVEKRFSAQRMTSAYESIYGRLVGHRQQEDVTEQLSGELLRSPALASAAADD